MTRILDKVVKKGWVQRVDALDDRRAYLIYLTDEGKRVVQATYPLIVQVKEKFTRGLSDDEIQTFVTIINKISKNLD